MKVQEIMTASSLKYCTPETNLHDAALKMREANCGSLPVVDENKKVLGIVTDRDICLSLTQNVSTPIQNRKIGEIMTTNVKTIHSDEEITSAYRQMRENRIERLPVTDANGKLEGIVSLNKLIHNSIERGNEVGSWDDLGENLMKTLHAVSDRHEAKMPA